MEDQNNQLINSLFDYSFPEVENDFSEEDSENNQDSLYDSKKLQETEDSFGKYHSGL